MSSQQMICPFCDGVISRSTVPNSSHAILHSGCKCGPYYIWHYDQLMFLGDPQQRQEWNLKRVTVLLKERMHKSLPKPFLQFGPGPYPDISGAVPVSVSDLLAQWPRTVPEKIERCFCHLVNAVPGGMPAGWEVEIPVRQEEESLLFTKDPQEHRYFIKAMVDYGWLDDEMSHQGAWRLVVTPAGWARFDELTRREGTINDPAFVAMWFGAPDRMEEMTKLYANAIKPAIQNAGYRAMRADELEHNEPIMDRVIEYIRKAPFVVAELTTNNPGVYYEGGFARGRGTEVIYCWPEADKENRPHFDVSGIYGVPWQNTDDLQKRLESRILGAIGRGPHRFDGADVSIEV